MILINAFNNSSTFRSFRGLLIIFITAAMSSAFAQSDGAGVPDKATDISPLLIGEQAPDIPVKTLDGKEEKLFNALADQPSVLIFYRGGWCPYCNVQLGEMQEIEKEVLELGYQIIAISPDSPENLSASVDKHKLSYQLFSDSDMSLANAFGIAFKVPESSLKRLDNASGGDNPGWLPVPSVFVLNTNGEILFEYINPNYKTRLKGSLLLAVLKELK